MSVDAAAGAIDDHRIVADVDDGGYAQADPEKLRLVLDQLVSNAVKYSPGGGTVTVSAHRTDDAVEVAVADEGIGIPAAERERIFTKFYKAEGGQGPGSASSSPRGSSGRWAGRCGWSPRRAKGRGSCSSCPLPGMVRVPVTEEKTTTWRYRCW